MKKLLFGLLCCVSSPAADSKWNGTVSVQVMGDPQLISQVSSYLKRELRTLVDVTITDADPDFTLSVVSAHSTSGAGNHLGYILSVLVTSPFPTNLTDALPTHLENIIPTKWIYTNYVSVNAHWVEYGPWLKDVCVKVIADFDTRESRTFPQSVDALSSSRKDQFYR